MSRLNKRAFEGIAKSTESQMRQDALKLAKADTHVVKCPKCGSEITVAIGSNVCRFCGAKISFNVDLD